MNIFRNIGDTVLSVQARENAPESLSLTELWDMELPSAKLCTLLKFLPNLSHLYTRTVWLSELSHFPPSLTHLTADFDFVHNDYQLFNFLEHSGSSLRKLILIDQVSMVFSLENVLIIFTFLSNPIQEHLVLMHVVILKSF